MRNSFRVLAALGLLGFSGLALAAGGDFGQTERQPTNWTNWLRKSALMACSRSIPCRNHY